jgi:hypothetical protein
MEEEQDVIVLISPDRREKVCIYQRAEGSFGSRNFIWVTEGPYFGGWTIGREWGHFYDTPRTALRECAATFSWIGEYL